MRWWPLLVIPALAHADAPSALLDDGRTWIYDVTTTTYDIENWGSLTRPPKVTKHAVVTCTRALDAIACDGTLEPPVAGTYRVDASGLSRDGQLVLAASPKSFRHVSHDVVEGVRGGPASWCIFTDSSTTDDGAITEQCIGSTGIVSGAFDGGGGDWRRVTYRLRATRAAPAARTP